jgi:parallel beta-helix repeat protein
MNHASPVRSSHTKGFYRSSWSGILGLCLVTAACWGVNVAGLSAATYYVDATSGKDGNPGTIDAPWQTLSKGINSLKPGDTALVRGGVYREAVVVTANGQPDKPITLKAYPGETPIVDWSLPVTGWTQCQAGDPGLTCKGIANPNTDKIYVAQVDKALAGSALDVVLFENQVRLQMACDPAQSNPVYDEVTEFRPLRNEGGNWGQTAYLVDSAYLTQPDGFWNGAEIRVWSHLANNWVLTTTVQNYIAAEHKIVFSQALANPLGEGSAPDGYLLVNHPAVLDQPGEFYVAASDTGSYRVYLWPRSTADLNGNINVLDGRKLYAAFLTSSTDCGSYVVIDGLTVRMSRTAFNWVRWNGSSSFKNVVIRNCTIRSILGAGLYMNFCENALVENCQINDISGDRGIMFGASVNTTIRNNVVDNTEQTGIYFAGDTRGEIVGNRVGRTGTHGNGITTYDGCSDILIANNIVTTQHVSCTMLNSSNLTYFNNILYNAGTATEIANWGGMTGKVLIAQNVMLGGSAVWGDTSGHQRIVLNNILQGDAFSATSHDNNIFVSASAAGYNANEKLATNLKAIFVDPDNRDYHLAADSPARHLGAALASYLPTATFPDFNFGLDAAGKTRDGTPDAGAYQDSSGAIAGQPPVLNPIGSQRVPVGTSLSLSVSGTDPDGGTLSYRAYPLPAGATFTGQTLAWTPTAGQAGTYQITFEVTDGQLQDSETVTVAAIAGNTAPSFQAIGNQTVSENSALSFSVQATDAELDAITYAATNLPAGAAFSGRTFSWTPTYEQAGTYTITFTASDGQTQGSLPVTITVTNANRAPTLAAIANQSIAAESPLTLRLSATDPDGDPLTYSVSPMPAGATLTGDTLTWTPAAEQVGFQDLTVTVSDGSAQDSKAVSVAVTDGKPDTTAPQIVRRFPSAGAVQVPLNNLVSVTLVDLGSGINPASVAIHVDGQVAYQGDVAAYDGPKGRTLRVGTANRYRYTYQPAEAFTFDHTVAVKVEGADQTGNAMSGTEYSFATEMQTFGNNQPVCTTARTGADGKPATAGDNQGNSWVVWQTGPIGQRRVYAACRPADADAFGSPVRISATDSDQCNPDIARGADGLLYAVWQDNQRGNWDIYAATSPDGVTWSQPALVSDSDGNESNPAVAADNSTPAHIYVAWEDDRLGNADIYLADSSNGFARRTISCVTRDPASQYQPAIAVNSSNEAVVAWTDTRNGASDIYGASSISQTWVNMPLVTRQGIQGSPALAADPAGTKMHLLWVDSADGNADVRYASFDGLPGQPLTGVSIADDTSSADQTTPTILCTRDSRVFAAWQDYRHASGGSGDTDLFVAELTSGTAKTNVLVGDDGTNSGQSEPALGIDAYGNVYVVWTDARNGQGRIYYAATTFADPTPIRSALVEADSGATVGTDPSAIASPDDVSIVVPPRAFHDGVRFTISRILNPKSGSASSLSSYDFGPSGATFDLPVTVTIPYRIADGTGAAKPYWYDALTGAFSQQGITDVQDVTVSSTLHALRFRTTHFTPYYILPGQTVAAATTSSGGGGGGGCSLSVRNGGSPMEMILPVMIVAVTMAILRRRDAKKRQLAVEIAERPDVIL